MIVSVKTRSRTSNEHEHDSSEAVEPNEAYESFSAACSTLNYSLIKPRSQR
jgi:hypothetical protein